MRVKRCVCFVLMLALSSTAWVEILRNNDDMHQNGKIIYYNEGIVLPRALDLPFSESVQVGKLLFLSGQVGIKPGTLTLVPGGMAAQARQTMENIKKLLNSRGLDMSDIFKCTVMLSDMNLWREFNAVYKTFFSEHYPARSALGVNGLALGALVEVECTAIID